MKLKIDSVVDYGTHDSEKVLLTVLEDCNLKYYQIADTTYTSEGKISDKLRHFYWFPVKDVKKGDTIILYTKEGNNTSKQLPNGKTQYTYYWGLDNFVWNNDGDAAVLFEINKWKTTKVI